LINQAVSGAAGPHSPPRNACQAAGFIDRSRSRR